MSLNFHLGPTMYFMPKKGNFLLYLGTSFSRFHKITTGT